MKDNLLIFSGRSNKPLSQKIAEELKTDLSPITIKEFSDEEIWVEYEISLRRKDVFVIQSTDTAKNLVELFLLLNAAKKAKADRVIAVIPYFGYARQDIKDQPRVAMSAGLMCQLIEKAGATHVIMAELHNPAITNAFETAQFDHLYLTQKLWPFFQDISDLMVMSTDAGGAKMARYYATKLKTPRCAADKMRGGHNKVNEIRIMGDVANKNVLIVDDIADTCTTLTVAVESAKKMGAKDIYIACVHPVLSGQAVNILSQNQDIKIVYLTDTLDKRSLIEQQQKIKIISVADVFAKAIDHFHSNESIDSLFDQNSI